MYAIRHALRARPPVRIIQRRRYPLTPRSRSFHTSRPVAQAPEPPSVPDGTPVGDNGIKKENTEHSVADEINPEAVANEDPDSLAQKLQRSQESSRRHSAAMRRQKRSNKSQGLPPVHVPEWFRVRRITKHGDVKPQSSTADEEFQHLSIRVTESEIGQHAALSFSAKGASESFTVLTGLIRGLWDAQLSKEEVNKILAQFKEQGLGQADAETKATKGEFEWTKDEPELARKESELVEKESEPAKQESEPAKKEYEPANAKQKLIEETVGEIVAGFQRRVPPLIFTEIQAAVDASLATLRPVQNDAFPSAKTNLILHAPSVEHERAVDNCVHSIARGTQSDVIELHAQDLAQLAGDYLGAPPEPSPRSVRALGYETFQLSSSDFGNEMDDAIDSAYEEVQNPSDQEPPSNRMMPFRIPIIAMGPSLKNLTQQALKGLSIASNNTLDRSSSTATEDIGRNQTQSEMQLEDMKITALLEALVDSAATKLSQDLTTSHDSPSPTDHNNTVDPTTASPGFCEGLASPLPRGASPSISLEVEAGSGAQKTPTAQKSTIIYVKDFKEMNSTYYGGRILQRLEALVRRRRSAGESIMIIGSTCSRDLTPELSASGVRGLQTDGESSLFRNIVVAAPTSYDGQFDSQGTLARAKAEHATASMPLEERFKNTRINMAHIRDMLTSLGTPPAVIDYSEGYFNYWQPIVPQLSYMRRVLTYDEVHRIALTAVGIATTDTTAQQLCWGHVALAMGLLNATDALKCAYFDMLGEPKSSRIAREAQPETDTQVKKRSRQLQLIAHGANKYEKRLIPGIADPDQIKTTFEQVHVPPATVDSIRTITSLSLLRPDAFSYGILATEKISGALLYGPPGTGKTLLAKAVAKESGSTVLEVSGSRIMDKYVGEGEKNVAAVFSLARKLSPCIVFLDEADAIFASRDAMRERASHRDILNQFLKEWDGLNDLSVFVMVATNRPFDLDDAVIRRLPRRILVDLPTEADRKEILKIHLQGEQLDNSINLEDLAKRTPFYSGSDLKNVAISAALACVKEENEQAAINAAKSTSKSEQQPEASSPQTTQETDSTAPAESTAKAPHLVRGLKYRFPEKRIIHARHFDKALLEISASISEDMASLNAIKKFDEQYGDRKGNKRKKDFGFGSLERNDNSARVRV